MRNITLTEFFRKFIPDYEQKDHLIDENGDIIVNFQEELFSECLENCINKFCAKQRSICFHNLDDGKSSGKPYLIPVYYARQPTIDEII